MHCDEFCYPCLVSLIEQTVANATQDPTTARKAREAALEILNGHFSTHAVPSRIAARFLRAVGAITGNKDPFRFHKEEELRISLELAPTLAPVPLGDPHNRRIQFREMVIHAATGNSMDFFRDHQDVIHDLMDPEARRLQIDHCDHAMDLLERLGPPHQGDCSSPLPLPKIRPDRQATVLVLADNAGEVVFDRPLLGYLMDLGLNVLYVVKGSPVQNDATTHEVNQAGGVPCPVITTGTNAVGSDLADCSEQFRDQWAKADLIIAKGMANYETLTEAPPGGPPVLHVMQAKCKRVASEVGVAVGDRVALWRGTTQNHEAQ